MEDITLDDFRSAQKAIKGKVLYSPLVHLRSAKTQLGQNILLKAECLQPSGSFKIRGATYCLSRLSPNQKKTGVIAYSTGNHAQAVALAARQLDIKATIVMSPDAPSYKVEATKSFGAEVIMVEPSSEIRRQVAEAMAKEHNYYLVPPYDHRDIMTGQGTIGMEILEMLEPSAVFVPVGGGGLIAGIALAIKQQMPQVKMIGVEPELENDVYLSFVSGKRVTLPRASNSIADAVKILTFGELSFPIIVSNVDAMVTVSEEQIAAATIQCLSEGHLLVEPSGALGVAAALQYKGQLDPNKPVVCIASGGNTTIANICDLINAGR